MLMRLLLAILFVSIVSHEVYSQGYRGRVRDLNPYTDAIYDGRPKGKFFALNHFGGELKLKGFYRDQITWRNGVKDKQQSTNISGGLHFKAGGYFWNPSFLLLDVDAEYNPESHHERYLIMPDLGEVNTMKNLDIRAVFLNQKKVTFGGNLTFNENYSNRENLSDIRSRSKNYGAFLNIVNKYAPISVNYDVGKWYQKEIQTGRTINCNQSELRSRIQTRFSKWDLHDLTYSHAVFARDDYDLYKSKSITDQLILNDEVHFDKNKHYRLNVITSAFGRKISSNYTRISNQENFMAEMPKNFNLNATYAFYHIEQDWQKLNQHSINAVLGHKLFNSLSTDVFGGYNYSSHSQFKGSESKIGFDVRYTKKIFWKGNLCLSYKFAYNHKDHESSSTSINVINEEYTLTDGKITLIDKPYIELSTFNVTDITGTIFYQNNLDYMLIKQGNYLEIQRIPGGQITNGGTVYISYTYVQPGNYHYNSASHGFGARLAFFKNILEFYYNYNEQDYIKLVRTEFLQLNTFTQNTLGMRVNYKFVSGGVEYDDYKSNIVPYYSTNYFLQLQGHFFKHLEGSLNGNLRYMTLTNGLIKQKFASVSAMLSYAIHSRTKISIQGSYMHEDYQSVNLDLLMAGADVTTSIRKMYFSLGYQLYRRNYLSEQINYNGGYVQISRKF